jgi:hypothetical protein
MKTIQHAGLIVVLLLTISCAALTRHCLVVERDEFLNEFPLLNNEILGELKYDDPDLDLNTLGIKKYTELFDRVYLTEDYKKVVHFVQHDAPERKFVVRQNTFIICLRSEKYALIICDDATTPWTDKAQVGEPIPALDDFCADFLSTVGHGENNN